MSVRADSAVRSPAPRAATTAPRSADPDWRRSLASPDLTFGDAIGLVSSTGVAVIVDEHDRLLGIIDDGDVRRALLDGVRREDPARPLVIRAPVRAAAGNDFPSAPLQRPLPIVDETSRVIGLQRTPAAVLPDRLAVLMAGGLGTRLRPLTTRCPKPMLRVGGRPLLERLVGGLHSGGFRRLTLCVGYRAGMVMRHFGDGRAFGVEIDYVHDHGRLGTAGPLGMLEQRPDRPFLVINGDIVTSLPFDRLLAFHEESNADATVAVCEADVQVPYGIVELRRHRVAAIKEKPIQHAFVNTGMYVLEPSVLDWIERGRRVDMPSLLDGVIARGGNVVPFPLHESWMDIGNHDDLGDAERRTPRPLMAVTTIASSLEPERSANSDGE